MVIECGYSYVPQNRGRIWYNLITKLEGFVSWDLFCKALIKECAQDFITYFAPGARYVGMRECQVQTRMDGPFDPREMRGDIVPEAERAGERFLLNTECQSSKDERMDERLLGYSYELTRLHGLPVRSAVIYTQPVNDEPQAPLIRKIPGEPTPPDGTLELWFNYASLKVCEQPVEEFRALDLDAFAVLMLLCKDGGTPAILDETLQRLLKRKDERRESIAAAFFFAGKVFKSEKDLKFLERKSAMLDETLKDNWMYQHWIKKGLEEGQRKGHEEGHAAGLKEGHREGRVEGRVEGRLEGRMEGRSEGLERGRVEEARKNIELFVEKRFPALLAWVTEQIGPVNDLQVLQEVLSTMFTANTEDEIRAAFPVLR